MSALRWSVRIDAFLTALLCLSGAMTWFIRTSLHIVRVLFNQAADEMPSNGTSSQASSIIEYPSSSHGFVQVSRGPLNQAAGVMASNGASSQASNSVSINETPSTSHGSDPDYVPSHTHTPSSSDGSDLTPSSAEGSGSI
ncbi:hypothetical protein KY285_007018 [Solanum tuberosum]|nr:hypothetical protein KY285_007018 [Solanum tuberosum]